MRNYFLLSLPVAALMMLAGCADQGYQSSSSSAPRSGSTATASTGKTTTTTTTTTAAAPSQATYQSYSRNSTTQPLPSGWGYMHEGELTGGRLTPGASQNTSAPVVLPPQASTAPVTNGG